MSLKDFLKNNQGVYGRKDLSLNYFKQWDALKTDLETASKEKQEVDKKTRFSQIESSNSRRKNGITRKNTFLAYSCKNRIS